MIIQVIPHPEKGWCVKTSKSKRAHRKFSDRDDALVFGALWAMKRKAELAIHNEDGSLRRIMRMGKHEN